MAVKKDVDLDALEEDFDLEGDTELNVAHEERMAAPPSASDEAPAAPRGAPSSEGLGEEALRMTADIPVQIVVVLGKKRMVMQDLLQLQRGALLEFGQPVSTVVDLVANGKLVAKGELIEIDGKLGVRITQMIR